MQSSNIVIGLAVLAFILWRQLQPRAVREDQPYRIMAILGVIGIVEVVQFAQQHSVPVTAWALLALSLVIGMGFGALRGATVHVWRREGVLTRQGNWLTVVLWLVSLGIHLGADALIGNTASQARGLADVALLLYLALALGAQRVVTLQRAERHQVDLPQA